MHVNHTGRWAHTPLYRNCWKKTHVSNFPSDSRGRKSFLISETMHITKLISFPFLLQLPGSSDLNVYSHFNKGRLHLGTVVLNLSAAG